MTVEQRQDRVFGIVLMVPALAIVGVSIFAPLVKSLWMSFINYSIIRQNEAGAQQWNDLKNYAEIFASGELVQSLGITFTFMLWTVSILLVLGLSLALLLNSMKKGERVFRTLALLPWVTPTLITALLWNWMFQANYGVINYVAMALNIVEAPIPWLTSTEFALPAVITAAVWRELPFMFILLLAGLQSIPREMYEAAEMEGAGAFRSFRSITLPFLRNVIRVAVLLSIITNFKQFPLVWNMTAGGPLNATTSLAILSYKKAFVSLDFGQGAAVAAVWLVVLVVFTGVYTLVFKNREVE